ncbi:diguanylate cyclase domain-containing protein [Actinokineospora sp.]|uniref:diguanylate cyclase domain-containing protein n=1 Tax=Actinokineospora sp. TaxID=1872133 RepID=UPI003D6A8B77
MAEPTVRVRTDQDTLVRSWLRAVAATAYVPRTSQEITADLSEMVATLVAALVAEPFDTTRGTGVGERMVADGLIGETTLQRSVAALAEGLHGPADRKVLLLVAVSAGYANALRNRTLAQQENMKIALHNAMRQAERDRRATESRFREVFASSAVGIAITELDGRFVETNPALATILACGTGDLAGRSLAEFISNEPDFSGSPLAHLPDRQRLRRLNGETAWVYAKSSLLPDETGGPAYRVTMVQDLSELHLLGDRLSHQLLHDALTGLANRISFESRLETMHGKAAPTSTLTLCCLDLDAFAMVNTTYGHEVGNRVLRTVAQRLEMVAGEKAVVARIGSDEFAILVQDGPPVPELVEAINAELSEPDYTDGVGLAISASIGVVRAGPSAMSSAELFRAGESALRQARAAGRRQWVEFDHDADKRDRAIGSAATALPAAWENGELDLRYDVVARLADLKAVRVTARPGVERPTAGLPSAADLAETTGLSVALGPWLLSRSTEQVPVWQALFGAGPVHRVLLSPLQSVDAELSRVINRAIAATGIPPGLLEVGLHTGTVTFNGDAQDNLRTLGDIGVVTALHGFTGGPREVTMAERFKVGAVLLADPFEGWRPDWLPRDCVQVETARGLIDTMRSIGVAVGVRGVRDLAEARWWAALGADTGEGQAFGLGLSVDDVISLVRSAK